MYLDIWYDCALFLPHGWVFSVLDPVIFHNSSWHKQYLPCCRVHFIREQNTEKGLEKCSSLRSKRFREAKSEEKAKNGGFGVLPARKWGESKNKKEGVGEGKEGNACRQTP